MADSEHNEQAEPEQPAEAKDKGPEAVAESRAAARTSEAAQAAEPEPVAQAPEAAPRPETASQPEPEAAEPEPEPVVRAEDKGPGVEERAAARRAARDARVAARMARQIGAFSARHGGAEGRLSYLGRKGTRIVLVGDDGDWGDLVAPSDAIARKAAEQAGLTLGESFDAALAAKVRTGPYEWRRMAGIQLGGGRPAGRGRSTAS